MSEPGNTILSITPKTKEDFGKYICSVTGLKVTVPDPIIVAINVQEEGQSKYIFFEMSSFQSKQCTKWEQAIELGTDIIDNIIRL